MTYVPSRLIPDEEKRLGKGPICDTEGCEQELSDPAAANLPGPSYCHEHFVVEWFDGKAGECADCGGQLVEWRGDDGTEIACIGCGAGFDDLAPKTSDRGGFDVP